MPSLRGNFCGAFQLSICKSSTSHKLGLLTEERGTIYLLCFLSHCFKGTALWLVSRELLRSHSFSQIPVLQFVGRASGVVGRGTTIVTVPLPVRVLLVHGTQVMGLGNIVLWLRIDKRRHWRRGLWRPQKQRTGEADEERVGRRESRFHGIPHEEAGCCTFSGWGGPQRYGVALWRVDAVGLKRFLVW